MQLAFVVALSLTTLSGKWGGEMKLANRTVPFMITFAVNDQTVNGTMTDTTGANVALEKITLEDHTIRFNVRDVSFEGTVNGDTISGRMRPAGTWSVKRGKADARTAEQIRAEAMRLLDAHDEAGALRLLQECPADSCIALRGEIFSRRADFENAIAEFTKAIAINPKNAAYYVQRGLAYRDSAQFTKAIADFTMALPLDPNNPTPYFARGTAYFLNDDAKNAVTDLTHAIALDPNNALYYRWRAKAYKALGMIDEAVADDLKSR